MSLLLKNKKAKHVNFVPEDGAGAANSNKKKRHPDELLRSVLKESTVGAAIEVLENNIRFRLIPDEFGNARYLALMLHADSIGGLSKRSAKKDEQKGGIVQQIISDHIEIIAIDKMLDREFFAIVPSEKTLEVMGEYTLLREAKYFWVVFTVKNGELSFNHEIGYVSYDQALAVQQGQLLQTVVEQGVDGAAVWSRLAEHGGALGVTTGSQSNNKLFPLDDNVDYPVADSIEAGVKPDETITPETSMSQRLPSELVSAPTETTANLDDSETDVPSEFYADLDNSDSESSDINFDELGDDDVSVEDENIVDSPDSGEEATNNTDDDLLYDNESDPAKESYEKYIEHNQGREVGEPEIRESMNKRFMSDALGLTIDFDEFDKLYPNPIAPRVNVSDIVPKYNTDWLATQLAPIAEIANAELAALSAKQYEELRQIFNDLTARHRQEVVKQVNLEHEQTKYGKLLRAAENNKRQKNSELWGLSTSRKEEIIKRYQAEADQAAEVEAARARKVYLDLNKTKRDNELAQVETQLNREVEQRFENERQEVLRIRRNDAELSFEKGKALISEALASYRKEQFEKQDALLNTWNKKLLDVIEENRKADIVRAEALAEQLARENAVDQERRLAADRLEEIRADHKERIEHLESRLKETEQDALAKLRQAEAEWLAQLRDEQDHTKESNEVVAALQAQIKGLSGSIHEQYRARIDELRRSRESLSEELEIQTKSSGRLYKTLLLVSGVLVLAALAIGGIAGWVVANNFVPGVVDTSNDAGNADTSGDVE